MSHESSRLRSASLCGLTRSTHATACPGAATSASMPCSMRAATFPPFPASPKSVPWPLPLPLLASAEASGASSLPPRWSGVPRAS